MVLNQEPQSGSPWFPNDRAQNGLPPKKRHAHTTLFLAEKETRVSGGNRQGLPTLIRASEARQSFPPNQQKVANWVVPFARMWFKGRAMLLVEFN